MALTKAQIVNFISHQIGFPKNRASVIVETLLEIVKKTLESGEDVMISNFGKFCVKEKGARRGNNLATSGELILRPRRVVTFKWSGKLKKKLNGRR